jgi:hypothetical protein
LKERLERESDNLDVLADRVRHLREHPNLKKEVKEITKALNTVRFESETFLTPSWPTKARASMSSKKLRKFTPGSLLYFKTQFGPKLANIQDSLIIWLKIGETTPGLFSAPIIVYLSI